ncbi:shikimate kinase 2 [Deltaproteobacteria bacterium]|nr:shikimate kinase 2 [Deltaproteobacteria bacterium]
MGQPTSDLIFLVGPRAAGKTSVGRRLAEKLAFEFVDTDDYLQRQQQLRVAEIVAQFGWAGFRELEGAALRAAGAGRGRVVATGGGVVLAAPNRNFMRERGLVFYLSAPAEILAARLAAAPETGQRPSLTGRPVAEEVAQVLAEREDLYRQTAHQVVDAAAPPDRVAADILNRLAETTAATRLSTLGREI